MSQAGNSGLGQYVTVCIPKSTISSLWRSNDPGLLPILLHGCKIKSGLGTRLQYNMYVYNPHPHTHTPCFDTSLFRDELIKSSAININNGSEQKSNHHITITYVQLCTDYTARPVASVLRHSTITEVSRVYCKWHKLGRAWERGYTEHAQTINSWDTPPWTKVTVLGTASLSYPLHRSEDQEMETAIVCFPSLMPSPPPQLLSLAVRVAWRKAICIWYPALSWTISIVSRTKCAKCLC